MRGDLSMRVTRSHTGRSADVDHDYRLAQRWASRSGGELTRHAAREKFVAALSAAPMLQGPTPMFRVLTLKQAPDIKSWEDMGPPKPDQVKSGGASVGPVS